VRTAFLILSFMAIFVVVVHLRGQQRCARNRSELHIARAEVIQRHIESQRVTLAEMTRPQDIRPRAMALGMIDAETEQANLAATYRPDRYDR